MFQKKMDDKSYQSQWQHLSFTLFSVDYISREHDQKFIIERVDDVLMKLLPKPIYDVFGKILLE